MRKTKTSGVGFNERMLVSGKELPSLLSCGYDTAVKIGDAAGARVKYGKRVLWNTEKIRDYLNDLSK